MNKTLKFLREVKSEAKKVSWTSFGKTKALTIVVTLISAFIAMYLLLIDNILQQAVDFIVKFQF